MSTPTRAQIATAEHVAGEIMVIVNEWLRDGADIQDLIAALGKATADVIITAYGADKVAPWFLGMAVNAANLPGETPN